MTIVILPVSNNIDKTLHYSTSMSSFLEMSFVTSYRIVMKTEKR